MHIPDGWVDPPTSAAAGVVALTGRAVAATGSTSGGAVHIPDGWVDPPTSAAASVVALTGGAVAAHRIDIGRCRAHP